MKAFMQRYLEEVAKIVVQAVDCILLGMGAGLVIFSAFYVFVSLYGVVK